MHIVRAELQSVGRLQVEARNPPGVTFSELVCCIYGHPSRDEIPPDSQKWLFQNAEYEEQSIEALAETIAAREVQTIAGVIELRLSE